MRASGPNVPVLRKCARFDRRGLEPSLLLPRGVEVVTIYGVVSGTHLTLSIKTSPVFFRKSIGYCRRMLGFVETTITGQRSVRNKCGGAVKRITLRFVRTLTRIGQSSQYNVVMPLNA